MQKLRWQGLLTSCGSKLSQSDAMNILNARWQPEGQAPMIPGGPLILQIDILYMGECELSRNQMAETGADARWIVRYYLHATNQRGQTVMMDGERTSVIERINGQLILAPYYRTSCNY